MIKLLSLITSITFLVGCASNVTEYNHLSIDNQRYNRVISSTNENIRGLYSRDNNFDLSKFDQSSYEHYLAKGTSNTAAEMKEFYSTLSTREFTPYKNTYVFCGFSKKEKLAFCDDPTCSGVEYIISTNSPNFTALKNNLPLKACK